MMSITTKTRLPVDLVRIDSSLTNGLKFECSQCGKCCSAGPAMTFDEAYELKDVFAMRLSVQYSIADFGYKKAQKEDQLADHEVLLSLGLAHVPASPESPPGYIYISPFAYSYKTGRCPALEQSGACGIYSRRPTICKSVPFTTIASNEGIRKRLEEFGDHYGCVTRSNNSHIDVDGLNSNREAMHGDALSGYAYMLIKSIGFEAPTGHSSLSPDIISMTFDMADMFKADVEPSASFDVRRQYVSGRGKDFARAQIKILEKSVCDAVLRKDKNDLEITRMHKASIKKLQNYLTKAVRV